MEYINFNFKVPWPTEEAHRQTVLIIDFAEKCVFLYDCVFKKLFYTGV